MSKREKRLERMRNNPWNVKFSDLRNLLEELGFKYSYKKHHKFKKPGRKAIIIAAHRENFTVHSKAVKEVLQIIDEILEDEQENER